MEDVYLKGRFSRGRHKNCVINPGLRDTGHVTAAAGLKHPRNAAPRPATIKLLRVTTEDQEMFNKSWKRTFAEVFIITEKASIRAFSWLKAPTSIDTIKKLCPSRGLLCDCKYFQRFVARSICHPLQKRVNVVTKLSLQTRLRHYPRFLVDFPQSC